MQPSRTTVAAPEPPVHVATLRRHAVTRAFKGVGWLAACFGLAPGCAADLHQRAAQVDARGDVSQHAKSGPTYYFSDCQVNAASGCTTGNNANSGLQADAPRRDFVGFEVNSLPAGTRLLFARGGSWTNFKLRVVNLRATPTNPVILDAYGSGPPPLLRTSIGIAIEFGSYNEFNNDGGYTLRNLKFDGMGTGQWALWLRSDVRNVTVDNVEITGFETGIHSQSSGPHGISGLVVRNSHIHGQRNHGMLGGSDNMLLEGNRIENNNPDGGAFEHGIYLGGRGRNGVIRNNTFANNSAPGGVCNGGNLTIHGQWDGLLIEGNTITQTAATGGCYGMSITTGYDTAEFFRNFIVRGNTIVNVGHFGIVATSAPNIIIENNKVRNTQATYQIGIGVGGVGGPGDDVDSGAVVRNNTVCFTQPASGSAAVRSTAPGATEAGTVYQVGAAATTGACAP